jgi:hypothetical protein
VLDKLLDRLDPAVVVEDTYPDQRYARLPSLAGRPRILVLRRLDRDWFDTIRMTGAVQRYDQILFIQSPEDLDCKHHGDDTRTAVVPSGRFGCSVPSTEQRAPTRPAGRAPGTRQRTACCRQHWGAGGGQMPDGYGDRLFRACHAVAAKLARERVPARFVVVIGRRAVGLLPWPDR